MCLKSPQIHIDPSLLTTGTIGVAQFENLTGTMIPLACNLSNSSTTLSLKASGKGLALKNCGVARSSR